MKNLFYILLLIGCNPECPDCNCPDHDTIYVNDTALMAQYRNQAIEYIETTYILRNRQIDSIKQLAIKEVIDYRIEAMAEIQLHMAILDSLKNVKYKDNMFIRHNEGVKATAYFDSLTGKPILRME